MTFLEKIKQHLITDDILVQEIVLHALHDYPNVPEEWTNELLREAFKNKDKRTSIFIYIENQTFNEEAVQILIENIPKLDPSEVHLTLRVLDQIEPQLALKYKESLKAYIREDMWELYELINNGTEDEVYFEYDKLLHQLELADSFQHDTYKKAKKLAACIAEKGWVSEEGIDGDLQVDLKEEWFTFNGILNVYMIGLLKLEKYIPVLASLLNHDDDILLEEVAAALISFQSDEVVKAVAPYVNKEESIIFAASIIENIKTDLAVKTLRKAYRSATELGDQDTLIEALCHQFSDDTLPEIKDHMKLEYSSGLVDVEQVVYGYFTILGLKHPELKIWKQVAFEREMEFRNEGNQVPFKNETKVGRNDPCPCGSGKKYKKCCGK